MEILYIDKQRQTKLLDFFTLQHTVTKQINENKEDESLQAHKCDDDDESKSIALSVPFVRSDDSKTVNGVIDQRQRSSGVLCQKQLSDFTGVPQISDTYDKLFKRGIKIYNKLMMDRINVVKNILPSICKRFSKDVVCDKLTSIEKQTVHLWLRSLSILLDHNKTRWSSIRLCVFGDDPYPQLDGFADGLCYSCHNSVCHTPPALIYLKRHLFNHLQCNRFDVLAKQGGLFLNSCLTYHTHKDTQNTCRKWWENGIITILSRLVIDTHETDIRMLVFGAYARSILEITLCIMINQRRLRLQQVERFLKVNVCFFFHPSPKTRDLKPRIIPLAKLNELQLDHKITLNQLHLWKNELSSSQFLQPLNDMLLCKDDHI